MKRANKNDKFINNISSSKKYKMLVVDDEEVNLIVIRNYLTNEGYEIDTEYDGKDCLAAIEREKDYDLILLDVMLPDLSGFEVCREIRKKYSHFDLPILFLTAKAETKNIVEGFESGGNDYLTKPFERLELLSRIKTLLHLKSSLNYAVESSVELEVEKQKREEAEEQNLYNASLYENFDLDDIFDKIYSKMKEKCKIENMYVFIKENDEYEKYYSQNGEKFYCEISDKNEKIKTIEKNRKPILCSNSELGLKTSSRDRHFLFFPMISFKNVFGIIILEINSVEKEKSINTLNNFLINGINAIENAKLFKDVEDKNEELIKKKILIEKNMNKLKAIEKFATIIYSNNGNHITIRGLLFVLVAELGFNIKKSAYFIKNKESEDLVLDVLYEEEKILFLDYKFKEKYLIKIEEFIKELEEHKTKIYDVKIKDDNTTRKSIFSSTISFFDIKCKNVMIENILINLNSSKGYFLPVCYGEERYGFIFVEVIKKMEIEEENLIKHLIEVMSLSFEMRRLENERMEQNTTSDFRCIKCNRKLLEYKGKIDYIQTKCSKCNTLNIIHGK